MRKLFLLFICLLAPIATRATELTDLGHGLAYLRIHSLADSEKALRSAVPGAGALVLDLRYATASDESVDALRAALTGHAAGVPLFVLVSPLTPPNVAQTISQSAASVFTLGLPGSVPAPKVVVKTDAENDRKAYDAFDAGAPVAALISGKIDKDRFDEATLVKEFKNGNADAEPPPGPDPTAPKPANTPEKPVPLVDRVLQRAVHLHHALVALRSRG